MDIIKRYIYAVQKRLPDKNRADIAKELNSLILDDLEGKFGQKSEYTADEIQEVLKEMGHPSEVASRYRGDKQLLIGPRLYPFYKMLIMIAAGCAALGLTIAFIIQTISHAASGESTGFFYITGNIFQLFGGVFSAAIGIVGIMTIIFVLIERYGQSDIEDFNIYENWKPKDLPELPSKSDRVHIAGPIVAMFFMVFGVVLLNFFVLTGGDLPAWFDVNFNINVAPIFNFDALRQYLPLWNASFGLSFILQMVLLKQGRYQLGSRMFEIGISIFDIGILAVIYSGPMVINLVYLNDIFGFGGLTRLITESNYYTAIIVLIVLSAIGILANIVKLLVNLAKKANI